MVNILRSVVAFLTLGRLHFLFGGFVLHGLGVAMAIYAGATLNTSALLWGQIAISATQLMTHYANDYFDLEADRANQTPTRWSGGSRVLVEQRLPRRTALTVAVMLAIVAFAANIILSFSVGLSIGTLTLLLPAQLLAWFYSAPPLRLHSRGLGELTTMLVVTLLTPLTGYYLQAGRIDALPLLAVVPLCCFQFAMLLSIEFPDAEGDLLAGKRTLVVRWGAESAARLYSVLILAAYVALPLLVLLGLPALAAVAIMLTLPVAAFLLWRAWRGDWHYAARWNGFGFYTIVLLMLASAAELAAFTLLIGLR